MFNTSYSPYSGMDLRRTSLILVLLMLVSTTIAILDNSQFSSIQEEGKSDTSARSGATAWLQDRADSLGNAGSHSSIEQAPDGTLWVAHTKDSDLWVTNNAAGYWNSEQIYTFGSTGRLANLQIDSSGNPRIAHFDASEHILRISRFDGSSWSTSTVAPGEDTGNEGPYDGNEGRIGFQIDANGGEHYTYLTGDDDLAYSKFESGQWSTEIIDNGDGEAEEYSGNSKVGRWSDLLIDDSGALNVVYSGFQIQASYSPIDGSIERAWYNEFIRHAVLTPGGWTMNTVVSNATGDSTEYYWLSGAFDTAGTLHIAYQNYSGSWFGGESVWLATSGSGGWNTERIHDGDSDGMYIQLMFDSDGKQKIAWYDDAAEDAILMREVSSGYEVVTVADSGNVGSFIDMVLDSNDEEIFSFYDATEEDLIVATPGQDEDGDGVVDAVDRCLGSSPTRRIDNHGCEWIQGELSTQTDDFAYLESATTSDGTHQMVMFEGYEKGTNSCDMVAGTNNNDSNDCNLIHFSFDGTSSQRTTIDEDAESGRYADIVALSDDSLAVSYMQILERNSLNTVTSSAAKVAIKTSGSSTWTTTTLETGNSTGWYTDIAASENGSIGAVWVDQDASLVRFSLHDGTQWGEPETVAINSTFPRIGFVGDEAVIFYRDTDNQTVEVATKNGSGWDSTSVISQYTGFYRPDIATGSDGTIWYVVQRGTDSSGDSDCDSIHECNILLIDYDSNGVGSIIDLGPSDTTTGVYPSVTVDDANRPHIAWFSPDDAGVIVAAQTPNGWEQSSISHSRNSGYYVEIVTDENGWETVFSFDREDNGTVVHLTREPTEQDHDLVADNVDSCPNTPFGEVSDSNGCSTSQRDDDNDGVLDSEDLCPYTNSNEALQVDSDGCGESQRDTDDDGVVDAIDQCPGTPVNTVVDNQGCDESNRDSDNDGINDLGDLCPNTPYYDVDKVDSEGCAPTERDTDGDGAFDDFDRFPEDATQIYDSDNDGFGDNETGNNADDCPFEFGTSTGEKLGCPDMDEDGIVDDLDDDKDGDGTPNVDDAFPNDSTEWSDVDLDGYGGNIDPDDDNDGAGDQEEIDCGSDPLDADSLPPDEDGDGTCDLLDANEENGDGVNNTPSSEDAQGSMATAVFVGIAVIILIIVGIGIFLFTRSGTDVVTGANMAAAEASTPASSSQQGEMVPTDRPCGKCGAPGLVFIPAYQRHYCRVCSQYE